MALTAMVVGALLESLEIHIRVTRQQMDVAGLRQSLRIAQLDLSRIVRMAGRGGLARQFALSTLQNVADGTMIGSQRVAPGTDVLIVRGAFSSPVWQLDETSPTTFSRSASQGLLRVESLSRTGVVQGLDALKELLDSDGGVRPEPLLLLARSGSYGIAEIRSATFASFDRGIADEIVTVEQATLVLDLGSDGSAHTAAYLGLIPGGSFPELRRFQSAALLEELRFYVREPRPGRSLATPLAGRTSRLLSRARMIPGSESVHRGAAGPGLDIAEGIRDLQVALGMDRAHSGSDARAGESPYVWLHSLDPDALAQGWGGRLRAVRIRLLGESSRPDLRYLSRAIAAIENHTYDETDRPKSAALASRRYRRRHLQMILSLRNR